MSLDFAICDEPDLMITLMSGRVDDDQFCGGYRKVLSALEYRAGMPELVIVHPETSVHVSVPALAEVARLSCDQDGDRSCRTAVLVSDPLLAAVTLIYSSVASGLESQEDVRVFEALDPALDWLERSRDMLPGWVDDSLLTAAGNMPFQSAGHPEENRVSVF